MDSQFAKQSSLFLAKVPFTLWAIAAILGASALIVQKYPGFFWYLLTIAGTAVIAYQLFEGARIQREKVARAAAFANICGPILLPSLSPLETVDELAKRVQDFKEQIQLSGNQYADLITVEAYPYQAIMYQGNQLSMSWNMYVSNHAAAQYNANMKWAGSQCPVNLRAVFLSQVLNQVDGESVLN